MRLTVRSSVQCAALDEKQKARYSQIIERLATLSTEFSQHVLADEAAFELPLHTEADLAGLPPFVLDGAAAAATERKSDAGHVITLSRSLIEPFLVYSERRDLREKAYKAWIARGSNGGSTDNWAIIKEILALRAERAHLLGFDTFADFKLDDTMAKTAPEVQNLLQRVWAPAVRRAKQEERALEEIAAADDGANMPLEAWDWWHFAEKERVAKYALKAADLKPYLPLNQMIDAAFYTAHRLFGLNFSERTDLTLYHPDARAWDVTDANGRHLGPLHRRLFRAHIEAIRRLDERIPRSGKARRRRHAPNRRQRLQLRQGPRGAASFALPRRCPHPCSMSSAMACMACYRTSPTPRSPARPLRAISWNCPPSSTSTG